MKKLTLFFKIMFTLLLCMATSNSLQGQAFVEADPFAYALSGHSLHTGLQSHGFRLQIGLFAAEIPDEIKDNDAFEVRQSGYGLKLDYYGTTTKGGFWGVEYGNITASYMLKGSDNKINRGLNLFGVRAGYKWMLGKRFYIMPWIGLDKIINPSKKNLEIQLAGETYQENEYIIFPTIHIGFDI
ncbi:MAG: hypothetical protein HRU19_08350 [Pseudobacteriovorax sp.]|nr:hypothetical protein [Pseudobacteriovorax sp.]